MILIFMHNSFTSTSNSEKQHPRQPRLPHKPPQDKHVSKVQQRDKQDVHHAIRGNQNSHHPLPSRMV